MNLESNFWTNAIGALLVVLAVAGAISLWWFPTSFSGTQKQVALVFITGLVSIGGLTDDFIKVIFKTFKNKLLGQKEEKTEA